jgi:hypothetical protein
MQFEVMHYVSLLDVRGPPFDNHSSNRIVCQAHQKVRSAQDPNHDL